MNFQSLQFNFPEFSKMLKTLGNHWKSTFFDKTECLPFANGSIAKKTQNQNNLKKNKLIQVILIPLIWEWEIEKQNLNM